MVNREMILARNAKLEQDKKQKEASANVKKNVQNFDLESVLQNAETKQDEEMNVSKEHLKGSKSKTKNNGGSVRFIYKLKSSQRIEIANSVYRVLGEPDTLQCGFTSTSFLVSEELSDDGTNYPAKTSNGFTIIYSKALVEKAIVEFNLEYPDGSTSLTFGNVEFYKSESTQKMVAKIHIVTEEKLLEKDGDANEA